MREVELKTKGFSVFMMKNKKRSRCFRSKQYRQEQKNRQEQKGINGLKKLLTADGKK
jgi:hypothetical protein